MKGLVVFLTVLIVNTVNAQTCSVGGSSVDCTLCPSGKGTVSGPTFGADIALTCTSSGPTPRGVNLATTSPNCPIVMGSTGTPFSVTPGLLAPATASFAAGASTGTVAIGADSPTTSQTLRLGIWSTTINLGTSGVATITVGQTTLGGSVNVYAGTFAVFSTVINIGTATPSTGQITVGNPTRPVTIAPVTSAAVNIGNGASTGTVTIGRDSSAPTAQVLNLGTASPTINIATAAVAPSTINIGAIGIGVFTLNTGTINIGTGTPTSGTITVGNPTRPVVVAPASTASVTIASGASNNFIVIGRDTPTTQPAGTSGLTLGSYNGFTNLGYAATNNYIGQLSPSTEISTGATTSTLTVGYRTPSPTPAGNTGFAYSTINLNGLYHYYYWSRCQAPSATPTPTSVYTGTACCAPTCRNLGSGAYTQTNAASATAPVSSGYDTTNNRWYPPKIGAYHVSISSMSSSPPASSWIRIYACKSSVCDFYAAAQDNGNGGTLHSLSTSAILGFPSVGSGNYIYVEWQNVYTDSEFNVMTIAQVA